MSLFHSRLPLLPLHLLIVVAATWDETPDAWSLAFSAATNETHATALLIDAGWPIAWLSQEHVEGVVVRGWWELAETIARQAIHEAEAGEESGLGVARALDGVARRKANDPTTMKAEQRQALHVILLLGPMLRKTRQAPEVWTRAFDAAPFEADARTCLVDHGWPISWLSASQMEGMVTKSWWILASEIVQRAIHEPFFRANAEDAATNTAEFIDGAIRKAVGAVRLEADKLTSSLDPTYGRPANIIRPALQWAQGKQKVHLSIKYAARFNAPGALRVENIKVGFARNRFNFSADGEHSGTPKRYELDFETFGLLNPDACSWSAASVGKLSVVLSKASEVKWPRLLKNKEKVPNFQIWHEYQEKLNVEFNKR